MASDDHRSLEASSSPSDSSSPSYGWKERIAIPTFLAGIVGAGAGLLSKHRKVHGAANISATYATNFAIVTACYCGAREFVRISRHSDHDDLLNSAIGGFGSGALLGRLQGGKKGAIRYSIAFAVAGTAVDFATLKLRPVLKGLIESSNKNGGGLRLPEWSPIQILNEEELAAKQAREQKMYAQRTLSTLDKEES